MMVFEKGHEAFNGTEKTRFQKGEDPWNKDKSGIMPTPWNKGTIGVMKPNKTSFKTGQFSKENHPKWRGGITSDYTLEISSKKWAKKRNIILKRDNYLCVRCKKHADTVDHIIPWRVSKDSSPSNLQAMCRSCNSKKSWEDM